MGAFRAGRVCDVSRFLPTAELVWACPKATQGYRLACPSGISRCPIHPSFLVFGCLELGDCVYDAPVPYSALFTSVLDATRGGGRVPCSRVVGRVPFFGFSEEFLASG